MVLAIEPMTAMGRYEVKVDRDGWTARTKDGRPSAHYEHMVLVEEEGPEILTVFPEDLTSRFFAMDERSSKDMEKRS